ncbi:hypothetical protein QUA20_28235 [Microcoleus sp. Pol7_A1]|uniref:hypothetical protein n=1 Tax=Microcoleus sp. Pol7_A1 TaxID=2818893 RepID=UPI002FD62CEF
MSRLAQLLAEAADESNNPVSFIYCKIVKFNQYVLDLFNPIGIYQKYSYEMAT